LEFVKPRGKDPLPDLTLNVEDFISVKGIKALGNQVTTDKIKQVHTEDPLPFEEAEVEEDEIDESNNESSNDDKDAQNNGGELTLF
jgi:topoisomerase-4 subunit A